MSVDAINYRKIMKKTVLQHDMNCYLLRFNLISAMLCQAIMGRLSPVAPILYHWIPCTTKTLSRQFCGSEPIETSPPKRSFVPPLYVSMQTENEETENEGECIGRRGITKLRQRTANERKGRKKSPGKLVFVTSNQNTLVFQSSLSVQIIIAKNYELYM